MDVRDRRRSLGRHTRGGLSRETNLRRLELTRERAAVSAGVEGQEKAAERVLGKEAVRHRLRLEAIQRGEKGVYPTDPTDGLLLCSEAIALGYKAARMARGHGATLDADGAVSNSMIEALIARELRLTIGAMRMCVRLARLDQLDGLDGVIVSMQRAAS